MIKTQVTLTETIDILNELVALDPVAITNLVETRVPCKQGITDHPTVQVYKNKVGFLGILNGLFGTHSNGGGAIYAEFEEDQVVRFALGGFETSTSENT